MEQSVEQGGLVDLVTPGQFRRMRALGLAELRPIDPSDPIMLLELSISNATSPHGHSSVVSPVPSLLSEEEWAWIQEEASAETGAQAEAGVQSRVKGRAEARVKDRTEGRAEGRTGIRSAGGPRARRPRPRPHRLHRPTGYADCPADRAGRAGPASLRGDPRTVDPAAACTYGFPYGSATACRETGSVHRPPNRASPASRLSQVSQVIQISQVSQVSQVNRAGRAPPGGRARSANPTGSVQPGRTAGPPVPACQM